MLKGALSVGLAVCFVFLSFSPVLSGVNEADSSVLLPVEVSFYSKGKSCSEVMVLPESELEVLRNNLDELDFSSAVDLLESCGGLPVGFMKQGFVSNLEKMSTRSATFGENSCVVSDSWFVNSLCKIVYKTSYFLYSFFQLPLRALLVVDGAVASLVPWTLIYLEFLFTGGFPGEGVDFLFDVLFLCMAVSWWGLFFPFYLFPAQMANSFFSFRSGWEDPVLLSTSGLLKSWELYGLVDSVAIIGFSGISLSVLREGLQPFKEYELYGCAAFVYASGLVE